MTATFLHPAHELPARELEKDAPLCEECDKLMWLTQVETKISGAGIRVSKRFECKLCGASQTLYEQRGEPPPVI
jgi:hypothetical protein